MSGLELQPDLSQWTDISIPVEFQGNRFAAFGADPAHSTPYRTGEFTLSVNQGAGCNCPVFHFSAHLHGTHTECVGHISDQPYMVQDLVCQQPFLVARVITLVAVPAPAVEAESYLPALEPQDQILTKQAIMGALGESSEPFAALIIRTLPNTPDKKQRDYRKQPAPYFSNEAMQAIVSLGVEHLLVDLPSLDREEDEGRLSNHHIYWGVEQGTHQVPEPSCKSITEFVYLPDEVEDGLYLLSLNVSNIRSDAAPSRPILYRIQTS